MLNRIGSRLEEKVLGTDLAVKFFDRLIQNTFYAVDKPGVVKAVRIFSKGLASLAFNSLGTTYHREILDPNPATVIVDGKTLPREQYNVILASSLKIQVLGADPFYRLKDVNHDGRIHLYAGNEPYLNLVRNLARTFSSGFKPQFMNMTDQLANAILIETPPGIYYNLDAEMKKSAGMIEISLGPIIEIPEMH